MLRYDVKNKQTPCGQLDDTGYRIIQNYFETEIDRYPSTFSFTTLSNKADLLK